MFFILFNLFWCRKELRDLVQDFLDEEDTLNAISAWRYGEIPSEEPGDKWELLEDRIDQAINKRISTILQEWEVREHHFERAEMDILKKIKEKYGTVFSDLENFEKGLRNMIVDSKARRDSMLDLDFTDSEFEEESAHELNEESAYAFYAILSI